MYKIKIMLNFTNKSTPILLSCLIVSIMLHFTVLFLASGYKGFTFPVPNLKDVFFIHLKEEISSKPRLTGAVKHPLLKKFSETKDIKGDVSSEKDDNKEGNKGQQTVEEDHNAVVAVDESSISERTKEAVSNRVKNGSNKDIAQAKVSEKAADIKGNDIEINAVLPIVKEKAVQLVKSTKEKLSFDIRWLGIYVGKAILEATYDNGILRITSRAYSAPAISNFYKVEDNAESVIIEGVPVSFRIKQREGRYRSDKETLFDMNSRKVTYFNYLKGVKDEHILKDGVTWDIISGFFYLRTQPLDIGKTIYIDIFDSNKFYKAKVEVLRKEKIEIQNRGKVSTVIVKPELQSEGLFKRKGDILIWLTDDEKKIPVRVQTKVPVGNIIAELTSSEIK